MPEGFPTQFFFQLAFGIEQGVTLIGSAHELAWLLQSVVKETV